MDYIAIHCTYNASHPHGIYLRYKASSTWHFFTCTLLLGLISNVTPAGLGGEKKWAKICQVKFELKRTGLPAITTPCLHVLPWLSNKRQCRRTNRNVRTYGGAAALTPSSGRPLHSNCVSSAIMPTPRRSAKISLTDCQRRVFSNSSGMTDTVAM